jgi:hypothetical protein
MLLRRATCRNWPSSRETPVASTSADISPRIYHSLHICNPHRTPTHNGLPPRASLRCNLPKSSTQCWSTETLLAILLVGGCHMSTCFVKTTSMGVFEIGLRSPSNEEVSIFTCLLIACCQLPPAINISFAPSLFFHDTSTT